MGHAGRGGRFHRRDHESAPAFRGTPACPGMRQKLLGPWSQSAPGAIPLCGDWTSLAMAGRATLAPFTRSFQVAAWSGDTNRQQRPLRRPSFRVRRGWGERFRGPVPIPLGMPHRLPPAVRFEKLAAYWARRGDLARAAEARRAARLHRQTAALKREGNKSGGPPV
jgi:hypothetical protein